MVGRDRLERLVLEFPGCARIKLRDGRFLALSPAFARELEVPLADACRIFDLDVFHSHEVRRFRHDDGRVVVSGQPHVFVEPPDSVSQGRWHATLKIPVSLGSSDQGATLAFAHSLDLLEPLERLANDHARGRRSLPETLPSRRARAHIDHLFQERFRIRTLAGALSYHPDYLARCFRLSYGVTIAQYIAARRVALAASRLVESDLPIAQIAVAAGFYDQSHLTRAFGRILGTSPAAYRRETRSRNKASSNDDRLAPDIREALQS